MLECNIYLVLGSVLHLDTIVVPCDLGVGVSNNGTVKHQGVAIVFLSDAGFLGESGGGSINLGLWGSINS